MKQEFINDSEDMEWFLTVHLPLVDRVFLNGSALIIGNEDDLEEVRLFYSKNPMDGASALVYEYNEDLQKLVYTNTI